MGLLDWSRDRLGLGPSGPEVPIQELRFTVLDTELTGLDERRDDIVSIGALQMQGGRLEIGNTFQELVRPQAVLDGRTVIIHGITPSQLEAMPPMAEVLDGFLAYVEGTVLVGHCLAIDLAFLRRDARRLKRPPLRHLAVDTLALYGWLRHRSLDHPAFAMELNGLSLFSLAKAFEIPVEEAHTALGDAYVTAQLFQRFLPLLSQAGIRDLAALCRVGNPDNPAANLQNPGGQAHF